MPQSRTGGWQVVMLYAVNEVDFLLNVILGQLQLPHQVEDMGPLPADTGRIQSLPTISITEEHMGADLECPVCKDNFSLEESVRQLPCSHLFHNDCIVPWLEQHDTCPVCRKGLNEQNTATEPPGLTAVESFAPSSSSSSSSSTSSSSSSSSSSSTSSSSSEEETAGS
ncbi:E3 ubiquitin-protein ligase RNF126-like [Limanda limanda]|uniref:E3 ubiquitin-protein ligase RNF126-like n=1 Tax=Limanda limanda TaxID=27771 RepID=UPI0029C6B938|nr:E3 ubiquitin-protein ligase RNF126-like [Limanda limanda]